MRKTKSSSTPNPREKIRERNKTLIHPKPLFKTREGNTKP
jgi:hypothetical protein